MHNMRLTAVNDCLLSNDSPISTPTVASNVYYIWKDT